MTKYDFQIDLSLNTSTGIILDQLRKDSLVLEFGCAAGRMTRYMREERNCRVYIVEYDEKAYDIARQYAAGGICGDIMDYSWEEEFRDIRFDAVLFADVLEHLSDPVTVLKKAARLMKDDGRIYVSLPNITHNDILLKSREERFDYTSTGILDDSHVRFWGLQNLPELAEQCGLTLRFVRGTHCPTGYTEQYPDKQPKTGLLENILKERQCGEIYQFVFALDKNPAPGEAPVLRKPEIQSHVYLDTGRDFNPDEIVGFVSELTENGYHARWESGDAASVKRIRFDPVELQGCIVRNLSLRQNGEEIPLICPGGISLGEDLLIPGNDPMVYTDILPGSGSITLEADILIPGQAYLERLQESCVTLYGDVQQTAAQREQLRQLHQEALHQHRELLAQHQVLTALYDETCRARQAENAAAQAREEARLEEIEMLRVEIARLGRRERELQEHIYALDDVIEEKNAYESGLLRDINGLNEELNRCRVDIGAYITLANSKDLYAMELERQVNSYESMAVVRLYNGLRSLMKKVLRKVKRFVRRGEPR